MENVNHIADWKHGAIQDKYRSSKNSLLIQYLPLVLETR